MTEAGNDLLNHFIENLATVAGEKLQLNCNIGTSN
jgi:hypothetical protein